jgi:hypothetical protein
VRERVGRERVERDRVWREGLKCIDGNGCIRRERLERIAVRVVRNERVDPSIRNLPIGCLKATASAGVFQSRTTVLPSRRALAFVHNERVRIARDDSLARLGVAAERDESRERECCQENA